MSEITSSQLQQVKACAQAVANAFEAGKTESAAGLAKRKEAMGKALVAIKEFGLANGGDEAVGRRTLVAAFLQTRAVQLGWTDKTIGSRQSDCMTLLDNAEKIDTTWASWRGNVDAIRRGKKSPLENAKADLAAMEVAAEKLAKDIEQQRIKVAGLEMVAEIEKEAA